MNLTDDKYDHHEEEIRLLTDRVEKLEEDNSVFTIISYIGFKLGLEFSGADDIKRILKEVETEKTWNKSQIDFINRLINKVDEVASKN